MIRRDCADVSLDVKQVRDHGLTCLLCTCGDGPWGASFLSFPSLLTYSFFVLLHFTFYALPSSVDVDVVGHLGRILESSWASWPNSADFVRAEVDMPTGGTRSRATLYALFY